MKKSIILFLTVIVLSCASRKENKIENIYWVNSTKVDCIGIAPMSCLQVQRGETIIQENWELLYSTIEGFDYQEGFIYKLNIKETSLDKVPADASSIKYTLIEVLEKKRDIRFEINGVWVLESIINEDTLDLTNIKTRPQILIDISQMRISGTNGCNTISGSIKSLNASIFELNPLMETRMMCPDMEIPRLFSLALTETRRYKRIDNRLILINKDEKEVLVFKKGD